MTEAELSLNQGGSERLQKFLNGVVRKLSSFR